MSQPTETTRRLITLAVQHFECENTNLNADDDFFEVLGINSLQAMELLTAIEETFDVEIPDYELQGVNTFSALAEVIESRL